MPLLVWYCVCVLKFQVVWDVFYFCISDQDESHLFLVCIHSMERVPCILQLAMEEWTLFSLFVQMEQP